MPLPWAGIAEAALPRGDNHPAWKGDEATRASLYERTRKLYPLSGRMCEGCKNALAQHHHHEDRDLTNNHRANISLLCEECHKAQHPQDGENNFNAKLTAKQVEEIRALAPDGRKRGKLSMAQVADMYGVSAVTISEIVRGVKWQHEVYIGSTS
jgi:hypothetical protein